VAGVLADAERLAAGPGQQASRTCRPLLDHLPVTAVDLDGLPDETSRRLFEALRLGRLVAPRHDCLRR
jgi:hypothetical protein